MQSDLNSLKHTIIMVLLGFLFGWLPNFIKAAHAIPVAKESVAQLKATPRRGVLLGCYASGKGFKIGVVKSTTSSEIVLIVRRQRQLGDSLYKKAMKECKKAFALPECSDKRDNDLDGARDFPDDPECLSKLGTTEAAVSGSPTPITSPPAPAPAPLEPTPSLQGLELLTPPFQGEFAISNHFDHEYPRQFSDNNGFQRTTDGESIGGIDGHDGYDFRLPEGTPLIATADGVVITSGSETPFLCPLLNKTVSGLKVLLRHTIEGRTFDVLYLHLSTLSVTAGQTVTRGTVIGLSGNTGCSTGPHLHLEITERINGKAVVVDPFGWSGSTLDPWSLDSEGASSPLLWRTGAAPTLYREGVDVINSAATSTVGITRVRWMGRRDDLSPGNEFVEFVVNSRVLPGGTVDLTGARVRNNSGDEYVFPSETLITDGAPLRLYSGSNVESSTVRSWKRSTPVWSNSGDCVQLISATGRRLYTFVYGGGVCPSTSAEGKSDDHSVTTHDYNTGEALFGEMDMKALP